MRYYTHSTGRNAWLWRRNPDGSREISGRLWLLVWITHALLGLAALALAGEAWYRTTVSVPVMGVVDKVYAWPGTIPLSGREVVNYGPRFRYVDETGETRAATSGASHPSYNFPVGTQMQIRYFPGRDANIVIPGPLNWFVARTVALIALATLPLPLLASWWLRRWRAAGEASEETERNAKGEAS